MAFSVRPSAYCKSAINSFPSSVAMRVFGRRGRVTISIGFETRCLWQINLKNVLSPLNVSRLVSGLLLRLVRKSSIGSGRLGMLRQNIVNGFILSSYHSMVLELRFADMRLFINSRRACSVLIVFMEITYS